MKHFYLKHILLTLLVSSYATSYGMIDAGLFITVVAGGCCCLNLERRISNVEKDIHYRESNAIFEQEYEEDIASLRSNIKTHEDDLRGLGRAINMDSENFRIMQANQMALAMASAYKGQPPVLKPLSQLPHVKFRKHERLAQQKSKLRNSYSPSNDSLSDSLNSEDCDIEDNENLSDDSLANNSPQKVKKGEPIFQPIIARPHLSPAELDIQDMGAEPAHSSPAQGGECE